MSSQVTPSVSTVSTTHPKPAGLARDATDARPSELVERVERVIANWEGTIDDDAVSETTVVLPGGRAVVVEQLGYQDPDFVFVAGRDDAGHEVLLAVPPSQFIVTLSARSLKDVARVQKPPQEDHVHDFQIPRVREPETE